MRLHSRSCPITVALFPQCRKSRCAEPFGASALLKCVFLSTLRILLPYRPLNINGVCRSNRPLHLSNCNICERPVRDTCFVNKMVSPVAVTTLRDLFDKQQAESTSDNIILDRIKSLAVKHLPAGWKEWRIVATTKVDVLEEPIDRQILNKIRFTLPTVGIARAFNPTISCLSEKAYRDMKIRMLNCPFCLGLVTAPSSLAAKIRGSIAQNELVLAALEVMKHLMISRKEASSLLSEDLSDQGSSSSEQVAKRRK
ncbi:unnamed protein product [Acanthoscelides obtectus]|uniref:Uncharacterized protein n=1 Tax=Acanthoscelides obtectus TaxID=200917 RepID=A0A9P0Q7K4_ACAOB|nr:unnamed protein product [Acanthoscelides obtectus]CAK1655899.1 hypothetical protein AOBTE_LOCUS19423 [Acanthoscelides obtectus]